MSAVTPENRLRLVGFPEPEVGRASKRSVLVHAPATIAPSREPALSRQAEDARRVTFANLNAARMSALDARWILAVQVERALQGGRAAIITPDARERLLILAERTGLRAFDANLVIAVVQDAAREGEDPLGPLAVDRLRLVREGDASPLYAPRRSLARVLLVAGIVITIAALAAFAAGRWLLG